MSWWLGLLSVALMASVAQAAEGRPGGGIWKSVVPDGTKGEFEGEDVYGLAIGKHITTDCSINWVDPDTGKRYCFASGTSLVYFQMKPKAYLAKASEFLRNEERRRSASGKQSED